MSALTARSGFTLGLFALCAAACVPEAAGYDDVQRLSAARAGSEARWHAQHPGEDVGPEINKLLAEPLTADRAVRIALSNNLALQAAFEALGVARGELLQAIALPNPHVGAAMRFSPSEERPELDLDATISLSKLLFIPWSKGAGDAGLEAAKFEVTARIVELAAQTRAAFYDYQASAEKLQLQATVLQALQASVEMTEKLHEAGNVTDLNLASEHTFYEEARIEFARAEGGLHAQRERLNALMGVWGRAAAKWSSEAKLPEPEPIANLLRDVEGRVITASLDLAASRQRTKQLTSKANLSQAQGWLPEFHAGVTAERQGTEWSVGPLAEVELPLFDHGQGESAVATAELRRQVQLQADLAVRLRARTRAVATRLQASAKSAKYYRATVLPLRDRVLAETQLQYNAMSVGVFQLLQAKRDQIAAHSYYIELVHDYWAARSELEQLLAGSLPAAERSLAPSRTSAATRQEAGH